MLLFVFSAAAEDGKAESGEDFFQRVSRLINLFCMFKVVWHICTNCKGLLHKLLMENRED